MNTTLKLFVVIIVFAFMGCNNASQNNNQITSDIIKNPATASGKEHKGDLPEIKFNKEQHDFGLILQGEKVSYIFKYKNIGNADLIITNASASCGCTVPKFSSEPIPPGGEGEIEAIFDSSNRTGKQIKTITVWTNCQPNQTKLQITSEIVVPK